MSLIGKRKPVRQTILSFFGVYSLLMVVLSSGFISFVVYQMESAIWLERRQDAADNAADTVVNFIERMKSLLVFSARDLDFESEHDLVELKLLLDSSPAFNEIIEVSSLGKIIYSVSRDEKVLANSFATRQAYWFSQAREGIVFVGPVEYASSGGPYVIMAVSSTAGNVLAARIEMSVLNDVVKNIKLGSSGRIFVVDQNGYLLAHPDPILMNGYTNIANRSSLSQALSFTGDAWHGRYRNFQGVEVLGTASHIADTGWMVVAEVNVAEAFLNSRISWLIQLVGILLIATAAMFIAVRLLDRWIFSPLQVLRNGAEEIQFGDLSVRVPILRVDEIGDVAHSFNRMAESLQIHEHVLLEQSNELRLEVSKRDVVQQELEQLNNELETRVQTRTVELSAMNLRLQESERQFHDLVENIPAVTYQADLKEDGPVVTYVSPQIGELLGFTPAEWLEEGRWIGQIHPEDFTILDPYYVQMQATADHYALEYRLFSRSGKIVWVRDQGIVENRGGIFRYIQGVMSDITLERENKEILIKQALHDGLTALPNRNLFIERLGHVMQRAQRHPEITFAVLFLDLDGFKNVNDKYGHASGDQVLIETAARIKSCVREFDTVARFGGDEFVILVEEPKDRDTILTIADRILEEIERPYFVFEQEVRLSASIGMACCEEKYQSPVEVIQAADVMMYQVKMARKGLSRPIDFRQE